MERMIPAGGHTAVASTVASTGPETNISSSATDSHENAVCSFFGVSTICDQRERTSEPTEPTVAPPMPAKTNTNPVHHSSYTETMSRANAMRWVMTMGTMTFA